MLAVEIAAFRYQSDYDRESVKKCKEMQSKVIVIMVAMGGIGVALSEWEILPSRHNDLVDNS